MSDESQDSPSAAPAADDVAYRPDLPDWGAFVRWPADHASWIHPEDMPQATPLLPSRRVFCRYRWDGEFYHLRYGATVLRIRPVMWQATQAIDLEVGQQVEVLSGLGRNEAGIYRIEDTLISSQQEIEFYLSRRGMRIARSFARSDLRPIHVKHNLRIDFFKHQPPHLRRVPGQVYLDVGQLTTQADE